MGVESYKYDSYSSYVFRYWIVDWICNLLDLCMERLVMRVKDWLMDLAENHYWDMLDNGEVVILPIKENESE